MNAVITGGQGFIGHNLTCRLIKEGWKVHVVDNLSTGRNPQQEGATYSTKSIVDVEFMCDLLSQQQPDVVFHLAAVPRVSYSVEHPHSTTVDNVMGTVSLLEAVRTQSPKSKVVLSSSSSVYGGAEELPTKEDYPCDPKSPYALQKWQLEQWARMYGEMYNLNICCLRYFNVFGPFSLFGGAYSTVLSAWLYSLYVDPSVKPYLEGNGSQTRDFCFVDNVVEANILAATTQRLVFRGMPFNIAQGRPHSLLHVKELLEKISGKTLDLEMRPERKGDVKHTLASITRAKDLLGYNPDIDFEKQVGIMAEWYQHSYPK